MESLVQRSLIISRWQQQPWAIRSPSWHGRGPAKAAPRGANLIRTEPGCCHPAGATRPPRGSYTLKLGANYFLSSHLPILWFRPLTLLDCQRIFLTDRLSLCILLLQPENSKTQIWSCHYLFKSLNVILAPRIK